MLDDDADGDEVDGTIITARLVIYDDDTDLNSSTWLHSSLMFLYK